MARVMSISDSTVGCIWRANGLKPHRVDTFKVSNDPEFADQLETIVGRYLNPPEHALVSSVDEKSQIQELDRTQPGLPMKKGRGQTMTHDYKRNGTTTLFAALNPQRRGLWPMPAEAPLSGQGWHKFLRMIDEAVAADKEIYLICDNGFLYRQPSRGLERFRLYCSQPRRSSMLSHPFAKCANGWGTPKILLRLESKTL